MPGAQRARLPGLPPNVAGDGAGLVVVGPPLTQAPLVALIRRQIPEPLQ